MEFFITAIIFFVILSVLVLVHELGHFVTARLFGVNVEEFGFGFPPRAFGVKKGATIYSINWIPLGGFVKIKGEQGEGIGEKDSFVCKPYWQRIIILCAGVIMNVILVVVIFSFGFMVGMPQSIDGPVDKNAIMVTKPAIQILNVIPDNPAAKAGLKAGDVINNIDSKSFESVTDLKDYLGAQKNEVNISINRGEQKIDFKVQPIIKEKSIIGVELGNMAVVRYPVHIAVWNGLKYTGSLTMAIFGQLGAMISKPQNSMQNLTGPVGIFNFTGQMAQLGYIYVLQLAALISLNLAIFNILPIPALDGGRVLFIIIEAIRRKPMNVELENKIHGIAFALLILLVVVVTFKDLMPFFTSIIKFFQ